jgi:sporulation protein YlmC with PRC-barrel domain
MKRKFITIVSAAVASGLAFSTLAQETPSPKTDGLDHTRDRMPQARGSRLNDAAKASDIIGMTVKNSQDQKIGKVEDLAVDVESGRVVLVILSTGGFIGFDETRIAVPPDVLHQDIAGKVLHLDADKANLKGAPKFEASKWDEGTQSNHVAEVYAYYGEQPYFVATHESSGTDNLQREGVLPLPRNLDGTINTDGGSTVEKEHNAAVARNLEENNNTISTRNPDGTWSHKYYPNGNGTNDSWSRLGYVQQASKLMGTTVRNLRDEKLGKVENIVVDLSAGRIVVVIISTGGFLGMGDELSAVPPTELRLSAQHEILQLDASKETLAGSPHFKAGEWPDFNQPGYDGGVYSAYKVEPYFTTDADSTRRNVRDREERPLTPLDQGHSTADLNITAQIRKEIIADKRMSINARNVKIITLDGRVTLRGLVNTADEKRLIGEIANRNASLGNVDNQLSVKLVTNAN